ncbi:jg3070, partial [Pararge aegeria aegeria]
MQNCDWCSDPMKSIKDAEQEKKNAEEIERLLKEKEIEMEQKFRDRVTHEIQYLKDRFEFIL